MSAPTFSSGRRKASEDARLIAVGVTAMKTTNEMLTKVTALLPRRKNKFLFEVMKSTHSE
jgi:hypothetical protein